MVNIQKQWWSILMGAAIVLSSFTVYAESKMKPFMLASTGGGSVSSKVQEVKSKVTANGFAVVGEYAPYDGVHIVIVTNDALKKAAAANKRGGYIAAQRISVTKQGDKVQVAFTNPEYMAAAYRIKDDLSSVTSQLKTALGFAIEYGMDDGKTAAQLNNYHYTFGMEYFDEPYELIEYKDYQTAVAAVEKGLSENKGGTKKVYRIDVPNSQQTLFGVGLKAPEGGNQYMDDKYIMSEIDFKDIRSSAHLPYEILVNGNKIEALHARFRIAMNFPDLSMMGANSFMNIMPSPDAINEALTKAAGGSVKLDF